MFKVDPPQWAPAAAWRSASLQEGFGAETAGMFQTPALLGGPGASERLRKLISISATIQTNWISYN